MGHVGLGCRTHRMDALVARVLRWMLDTFLRVQLRAGGGQVASYPPRIILEIHPSLLQVSQRIWTRTHLGCSQYHTGSGNQVSNNVLQGSRRRSFLMGMFEAHDLHIVLG